VGGKVVKWTKRRRCEAGILMIFAILSGYAGSFVGFSMAVDRCIRARKYLEHTMAGSVDADMLISDIVRK
jgi:hypothetical protein